MHIPRATALCVLFLVIPLHAVTWSIAMASESAAYQSLRVIAPENNSAFWNAAGNVTIKVDAHPRYDSQSEDSLRVYMDQVFIGIGPVVRISDVNRGTHSVYAVIVDANGNTLITSPTIHFTLHKPSALLPNNQHRHDENPRL